MPNDRLDENRRNEDGDNVVQEWLHQNDDEMPFEVVAEDENMTPEQRAIQWAINRGGAQNL